MNEHIEHLMYEAGLTAQGCWDEMDDYDRAAIEKLVELVVQECVRTLVDIIPTVDISVEDWDRGYDRAVIDCIQLINERFGVAE